jgi:hypothetical protein
MAAPNYRHAKKQREAAQKKKRDEKSQRKAERKGDRPLDTGGKPS